MTFHYALYLGYLGSFCDIRARVAFKNFPHCEKWTPARRFFHKMYVHMYVAIRPFLQYCFLRNVQYLTLSRAVHNTPYQFEYYCTGI